MAESYDTTTRFKVDISDLKSAMQEAKRQVQIANSEFKAVSSSMDNWAKSSDGLRAKLTQLNSNLDSQKSVLSNLERQYELTVQEMGAGSAAAERLKVSINNQKAVVNNTEKEISKFESSLEQVSKAEEIAARSGRDVSDVLDEMEREAQSAESGMEKLSGEFTVMKGALASLVADGIRTAITAVKDLAGSVIEIGTNFSTSMAEVQAISGASASELEQLEKTAREFGATTVFSASESADALKYMALAGWSVEQSTSALGGVLNLAAASGMGLAEASDMVTDYLSAFGMEAQQSAYFADMLAYAQSNSNTSAAQLGEAYKNAAANLNAAGQDVETTTALLASMANQGLKGSEAGTALTAVVRDMTAKMKDGAIAIGDTQIQVMDANGNFRDLTDILKDVESATNGMGDAEKASALMTTFTADSIKGLNLILNDGVDKSAAFEEALRNSSGTAENMADIMNDNLAGDIKAFQSALEELVLKVFDVLEPALRDVIAFVQELANEFNAWLADPENQKAIEELGRKLTAFVEGALTTLMDGIKWFIENKDLVIAGIVAIGAGLIAMNVTNMIMGLVGAFKTFFAAVQAGKTVMQALNLVMSANPIGLVVAAVAALVAGFIYLWNNCDGFREFWLNLWEGIKNACSVAIDAIVNFFTVTIPEAFQSVIDWVQANWESLVLFLINPFAGLFKYFYDNNSKFQEFVDNAIEAIKQLPGKIAEWFSATMKKVTTWASDMKKKALETGEKFLETVMKFFSELPYKLGYALGYALGSVVQWALNVYDTVKTKVPEIIASVVKFFSELPGKINEWLTNAFTKISEWTVNTKNKAVEAGQNFITSIVNFFMNLPGRVSEWLTSTINNITQWVTNTKNKATEAGRGFIENVVSFIKSLPGKVWTWLLSAANKVNEWKASLKQKGKEAMSSMIESVVNAAKSIPDKMLEIGKNIVSGVWKGIKDAKDNFTKNVKSFFSGIVDGAKDALGINSPSKIFAKEVGKWIPEGIAVGVDKNAKSVMNAMKDLTMNSLGATRDGLNDRGGSMSSSVVNNYTQVINSPKELNRLEIYRQTKNLFSFAGGA